MIKRFVAEEAGGILVEYGLIALFVGLAIITTVRFIAVELIDIFVRVSAGFH